MKRSATKLFITLCCMLGTVFIFIGCKKLNIRKELRIDIATYFNNDYVIIKLDDKKIFADTVTSHATLGVAEILKFDYPVGRYKISVTVNGIEAKDHFRHKSDRFVYIKFDRVLSKIIIEYPDYKYTYD